ncbi:hypothetical protein [Thiomicrospira sp.]|uniref:hypothetical protein n=1 Tax=Thiomicrospira sp. TaxID=935 RepID=UPI002F91C255
MNKDKAMKTQTALGRIMQWKKTADNKIQDFLGNQRFGEIIERLVYIPIVFTIFLLLFFLYLVIFV